MLELTVNLDERSYPIYIGQSALQQTGRLREHIGDCRRHYYHQRHHCTFVFR